MKNLTKTTTIILVAILVLSLAACGGDDGIREGTYRSEGLLAQTWTFSGNNEVTLSAVGGLVATSGTYTLSGNTLTITSTLLGIETVTTYRITEITRNSFRIDGTLFNRQ